VFDESEETWRQPGADPEMGAPAEAAVEEETGVAAR
jgi:hypothetical protein